MATEQLNTEEQENSPASIDVNELNDNAALAAKTGKTKSSVKQTGIKQSVAKKKSASKPKAVSESRPVAKKTSPKTTNKGDVAKPKSSKKQPVAKEEKTIEPAKKISGKATKFIFQLKYHTKPGESLFITGNHSIFGNENIAEALPLQYLNEETWVASVDIEAASVTEQGILYNYILKGPDASAIYDWGEDKKLTTELFKYEEVLIADAWNFAGYYNNAFYTEPFQNVLLKNNLTEVKIKEQKKYTHIFKIKAPLLKKGETICLLGSAEETGKWNKETPILLNRKAGEDFHSIALNLDKTDMPLVYKYGIYDIVNKKFVRYEDGNNRLLFHAHAAAKNKLSIINDGFIVLA